jgi:translocation and assembly module TamB
MGGTVGRWISRLAIVALVVAAMAGAALWLAAQEFTLRLAAQQLSSATGGALQLEGVSGSLYGPLAIGHMRYEDDAQRITIRGLELDWSPRRLRDKVLSISGVRAASVEVLVKKTSSQPLRQPTSLRLPLDVEVRQASLATLKIVGAGGSETALSDLTAALKSNAETHLIDLTGIETPWGRGRAQLQIGTGPPFPLSGAAALQGELGRAFKATAKVNGTLAAMDVSAEAETRGGNASLQGRVGPFLAMPLQTLRLDARRVDLHDVSPDLPLTELSATLDGTIGKDASIDAAVSAHNEVPGPLDQNRLPLSSLRGRLLGKLEAWRIEALQLDLGAAGQFSGTGGMAGRRAELALVTRNLNLQGAYSRLRQTHAAGAIQVSAEGKDFAAQRLQTDLTEQRLAIKLDATREGDEVRVAAARLAAGGGELNFQGKLQLAGQRTFQATGRLQRFNPAQFGAYPTGNLNADLNAEGRLAEPLTLQLQLKLARSELRGQPLAGEGRVELVDERLADADVAFDLAGNRLAAKGAFGRSGDELRWTMDAPELARLDPAITGSAKGRGSLRGTMNDPALEFDLAAQRLRLPGGYAVAGLNGRGKLGSGTNGTVDVDLDAQDLQWGTFKLARAQAQVRGTRAQHTAQLSAAQPENIDLALEVAGGWNAKRGWAGTLNKLENRGPYALVLVSPILLEVGSDHLLTRGALLKLGGGSVSMDELRWAKGQLRTSGSANGLSVAYLQKLFPEQGRGDDVATDLKLAAEWSLQAADMVDGKLKIWRESGDATILSAPKMPLHIARLELATAIVQNSVHAVLVGQSEVGGTATVDLQTVLARREGRWGVAGDAPLAIDAQADLPSIAWASLFLSERYTVDGSLRLVASRRGPVGAPQLTGTIAGSGLTLQVPDYGIKLRDGVLGATFSENRLILNQFRILADKGELTATGSLNIGKDVNEGGAEIRADQLELLAHPDYQLTVSGTGKVALQGGKLAVSGDVRADSGQITLPKSTAPSLGEDVVVVNKPNAPRPSTGAVPVALDVGLDLGGKFFLRGHGLDAQLGGQVRVKSAPKGLPNGTGTIRVVKGTYDAYGQKLDIDRGQLSFAGPIDNPALDIVALRKNLAVEAGVVISGTALAPRVKLVSTPVVPDTEKLAWLVLGHGLEGSARSELDLLPVAAAALLSSGGGESPQGSIARTLGLDEIGVTSSTATGAGTVSAPGTVEQRALTIGKRVSSDLYLSYEAGLNTAARIVRLRYDLSRRWSVRAETGTSSALDLFYTLRFD